MIGEPEPVQAALDAYQAGEDEDLQPLVQIAFYEGVHPRKGFDWILERFGLCNAITTLSGRRCTHSAEDRAVLPPGAGPRAVRASCATAGGRDRDARGQGPAGSGRAARHARRGPQADRRPRLAVRGRLLPHRHVAPVSVVQMSVHLAPCPELELARELCEYGQRLSGRFQSAGEPPFEDQYEAYDHYLAILAGDDVEEGLAYFRKQAEEADPEEVGTYPAEVLVNLLLRLDRPKEALAVARKYLATADGRQLTCPSMAELCQKAGDYRTLAEVAREQGDAVHFLAGLLASGA